MPILSVIFRVRAIISLLTLCAMEEGRCRRRDKEAVFRLFTDLKAGSPAPY